MDPHAALLRSLGLHEAHVYDTPCGCVAAIPNALRPLLTLCLHGSRWRYLTTYRLHNSDRSEVWCGPVVDGCAVEKAA